MNIISSGISGGHFTVSCDWFKVYDDQFAENGYEFYVQSAYVILYVKEF